MFGSALYIRLPQLLRQNRKTELREDVDVSNGSFKGSKSSLDVKGSNQFKEQK